MSRAKVNLYYYKNEMFFVYPSLCLLDTESRGTVDRFNRNFAQRRLIYAVHSYIDLLPFQGGGLMYSKATVLKETPKSRDFFIQLKVMNLPVYLSINASMLIHILGRTLRISNLTQTSITTIYYK